MRLLRLTEEVGLPDNNFATKKLKRQADSFSVQILGYTIGLNFLQKWSDSNAVLVWDYFAKTSELLKRK